MNIQTNFWHRKLDSYCDNDKLVAKISKSPTITNRRIAYLIGHLSILHISAGRIQAFFATLERAKVFSCKSMAGNLPLLSSLSNAISAKDEMTAANLIDHGFPAIEPHLRAAMASNLPIDNIFRMPDTA